MNVNNKQWILVSTFLRGMLFFVALATKKEIFGIRITLIVILLLFAWSLTEYLLRKRSKKVVE
ncbi:MAG: hypothetical protein R2831_05065 [Chitinophagaceae bacterium]